MFMLDTTKKKENTFDLGTLIQNKCNQINCKRGVDDNRIY